MALDTQEYEENVKLGVDWSYGFLRQARKDFNFAALHHWKDEDKDRLRKQLRPALTFDLIRPTLKAVVGAEQTSRFKATFSGFNTTTDDVDRWAAEAFNYLYMWSREHGDTEHHESLAFMDLVICGMGCLETYPDFSENPLGKILTRRVPIFDAVFDPAAVEPNAEDRWWNWRDRMIPRKQFELLYENGKEIADSAIAKANEQGKNDAGWMQTVHRVIGRAYGSKHRDDGPDLQSMITGVDRGTNAIRLREYQWKEVVFRTRIEVRNLETDEIVEELFVLPSEEKDAIQKFTKDPEVVPLVRKNFPQAKHFRAHLVGQELLAEEEMPYGDFTLQFLTGEEDWGAYVGSQGSGFRNYFGLLRAMRDPQMYRNKFMSQLVHLWNANPKGVLIYENDLFENPNAALDAWNKAEGAIPVESGMISGPQGKKYEHVTNQTNFAGVESLLMMSSQAVQEASGVNPQYFGGQAADLKRTATSAVDFVANQNLSALANYFDALRLHRKKHARMVMKMMAKEFKVSTLRRILGPRMRDRAEFVADFEIQDFDVVVSETESKPTPTHEEFTAVTQFLPNALQMGFPIPPEVFEDVAGFLKPESAAAWTQQIKEFYAAQKAEAEAGAEGGEEQPAEEGAEEAPAEETVQ